MHDVTRDDEDFLIELLNTTPMVAGRRVDQLADRHAARRWATTRGGTGADDESEALRDVRKALQDVTDGTAPRETLAPHLERVSLRPVLQDGRVVWTLSTASGHMLAARALLAWAAISERTPDRLRRCANIECCKYLLDRSRANNAQWCSMALCGNRMKARRHYRRARTADPR